MPGVPHAALIEPEVAGSPATLVVFVHGERTVIWPELVKTMVVGPVYRHPGFGTVARSVRISDLSCEFVDGHADDRAVLGVP